MSDEREKASTEPSIEERRRLPSAAILHPTILDDIVGDLRGHQRGFSEARLALDRLPSNISGPSYKSTSQFTLDDFVGDTRGPVPRRERNAGVLMVERIPSNWSGNNSSASQPNGQEPDPQRVAEEMVETGSYLKPRPVPNNALMLGRVASNNSILSRISFPWNSAAVQHEAQQIRQRLRSLEILETYETTATLLNDNVTTQHSDHVSMTSSAEEKTMYTHSKLSWLSVFRQRYKPVYEDVKLRYRSVVYIWHRYRFVQLLPIIAIAVSIWTAQPTAGLSQSAMHLLAVFIFIFFSLISSDYEITIIVALSLTVLSVTHSLACLTNDGRYVECTRCGSIIPGTSTDVYACNKDDDALKMAISGFGSGVNWLVFAALQLGKAIEITNLGRRVSLWIFSIFGRSILGLGYAICIAELVLAPFFPSTAARGVGILMPIVTSTIAQTLESPDHHPHVRAFFALCASHANLISASLYLTGSAPNSLVQSRAKLVFGIEFSWADWFEGAIAPALVCMLLLPPLVIKITHEDFQDNTGLAQARWLVDDALENMGRITWTEVVSYIFSYTLTLHRNWPLSW